MYSPRLSPKVLESAERYRTLLEINNAIITNLTQESLLHVIGESAFSTWVAALSGCAVTTSTGDDPGQRHIS